MCAVALAGAAYWLRQSAGGLSATPREHGLAWLPAASVLVASIHADELRGQAWLTELLEQAAKVEQEADYRAFVEATGFDYARDLDRIWLGLVPTGEGGALVGIAEGRFQPDRIVAYAGRQGGRRVALGGVAAYTIEGSEPNRRFAFAFLDENRLAFARTPQGLEKILACVRRTASAVTTDPARRERLERFAAGNQVWVVNDDLARFPPPGFEREPELAAQLERLLAAARATPDGLELVLEGETREAAQAERLKLALETLGLVGSFVLGRRDDPASRALGEALRTAEVNQQGNWLALRVKLSRQAVAGLLAAPSAPPAGTSKADKQ